MNTGNKNMPTNRPSMKIGGDIGSHEGILPHNTPKAPMTSATESFHAQSGTSASPRGNTADERQKKMSPSAGEMKNRNAANAQTSQTSDWSYPS